MSKTIRVAYLIDTIEPNFGGTETQLVRLIERIDRRRVEPVLCFLRDSEWLLANRTLCNQYNVDFKSFFSFGSWRNLLRFATFMRSSGVDVLQTQFRDSNIVGTIAAKIARTRVLIATRRNQGYWHNRIELAILRVLNPLATHFIVNSLSVHRYVERVEHVPAAKMELIYNGIDLDGFRSISSGARAQVRAELGIPMQTPVVVLVGNLRPIKGIDVYIRGLREVVETHPDARFLIVGEGEERARLQGMCNEYGLNDAVRFLGSRKDVPLLLKASDIGVLSSHSEGLSNAIVEYMAAGLPVVCTDVGGNSEMVADGQNGYVVPAGDSSAIATALNRLLADPERARAFGECSAKRAVELFDIGQCVEKSTALYERLMSGEGRVSSLPTMAGEPK